ncbi:MAG: amidohydrolase [Gemmatimonadetes bacterium]|nr:amidohydrolase [Gemmatimonadota bacterium]
MNLPARFPVRPTFIAGLVLAVLAPPVPAQQQSRRLRALLDDVTAEVEADRKLTQVMVDKIFSFSELGFHEVETSRYLVDMLRANGFEVESGISGMPTGWWATWGSGRPVIAFGSDIDGIPKASQKPGVAYHDPLVDGAPGHGEGHNSGQAVNVTAAIALKEIMQRENIPGTLILWPGVAEELVGAKAWFVRDGRFRDVDAVFFTHVGSNLGVTWGAASGTGLVSVEFQFAGESAHGAGAPWRGRSALDAVELMNIGWNFRREHLRPDQRSHYVISDGGDQPNVVPPRASVWYYLREMDYPDIRRNFDIGIRIAEGAARMTDTGMTYRILGTAWPRHFNKVIAETMHGHIRTVGLPVWSEADQTLAKAVQQELGNATIDGLATELDSLEGPQRVRSSGGSDDIGDISWVVPTVTLRFPSNIPGLPGHNWSSAIAMATPIAHKGATAGAKVMARTALEFFMTPKLVDDAWAWFRDVQTKDTKYTPFIGPDDPPAIWLNTGIMREFKPKLQPFYFDETRFDTYLEQLGIRYPTLRTTERDTERG